MSARAEFEHRARLKRVREVLDARLREIEIREKALVARLYPQHVEHTWKDGEFEYFDAMFVSKELVCNCGETLLITREMMEE